MHWQQIVVISVLCVALIGLAGALIWLYLTRDTGQHASGERPAPRDDYQALEHWARAYGAAGERLARRRYPPDRCRHGYLALADGSCAAERVAATQLVQNPATDEAAVMALSHKLIAASVQRIYAEREARQTHALAQTAWATWQA